MSKKEGGRGFANIEDNIDTSIRRLEYYIKKNKERLIAVIKNNTNDIRITRTTITRKQKWKE